MSGNLVLASRPISMWEFIDPDLLSLPKASYPPPIAFNRGSLFTSY